MFEKNNFCDEFKLKSIIIYHISFMVKYGVYNLFLLIKILANIIPQTVSFYIYIYIYMVESKKKKKGERLEKRTT